MARTAALLSSRLVASRIQIVEIGLLPGAPPMVFMKTLGPPLLFPDSICTFALLLFSVIHGSLHSPSGAAHTVLGPHALGHGLPPRARGGRENAFASKG
jgi:hypothetical protein